MQVRIKRILITVLLMVVSLVHGYFVQAGRGCCSWHGGVCSHQCPGDGVGYRCCDGEPLSAKCILDYPSCSNKKEYAKIDKSKIREMDRIEITGIVSRLNNELRILPRNDIDINIIQAIEHKAPISIVENVRILASEGEIFDFEKYKPYFIISSIVLGLIFIILLVIRVKIFKT